MLLEIICIDLYSDPVNTVEISRKMKRCSPALKFFFAKRGMAGSMLNEGIKLVFKFSHQYSSY